MFGPVVDSPCTLWVRQSYPFGKGKIKAINLVLNSEVTLKEFVNPVAKEEEEAYGLKKAFPSCRNCTEEEG